MIAWLKRNHILHTWTKWSGTVTNQGSYVQWRNCTVCNKEQHKWN